MKDAGGMGRRNRLSENADDFGSRPGIEPRTRSEFARQAAAVDVLK